MTIKFSIEDRGYKYTRDSGISYEIWRMKYDTTIRDMKETFCFIIDTEKELSLNNIIKICQVQGVEVPFIKRVNRYSTIHESDIKVIY